jgi:TonB family protein
MISISRPRCDAYLRHLVALLALAVLSGCATRPTEISHTVVMTKVRPDPAHPVQLGENYPAESKILHEGVCKVKLTVTADGIVRDVSLTKSTGYPRLDQACSGAFVAAVCFRRLGTGSPSRQHWRYRLRGNWPRPQVRPPISGHPRPAGWSPIRIIASGSPAIRLEPQPPGQYPSVSELNWSPLSSQSRRADLTRPLLCVT